MSIKNNTTSLQNLLKQVNALPEAGGIGEDVTDETNAYTTKLATLETAIVALETELQGKVSVELDAFTVVGCNIWKDILVEFPFVIGQTWQEWINSPCNIMTQITENYPPQLMSIDGMYISLITGSGISAHVSIDGTESGRVSVNDKIQSILYTTYVDPTVWE